MPETSGTHINLLEDDVGDIQLATNYLSSSNSKHIDVKTHLLRDLIGSGHIKISHVATEHQGADILTKALRKVSFDRHREYLMNLKQFTFLKIGLEI